MTVMIINLGIEHIYMQRSAGQNTLYIALKTKKEKQHKRINRIREI